MNYREGRAAGNGTRPALTGRRVESRPRSSKLFASQSRYPCTIPSYTDEYGPKPLLVTSCVCSGTSSGNRRNNPHPAEAFMVWRFSSRFPPLVEERRTSSTSLRPEVLIAQQQLKSTYQDDYITRKREEMLSAKSSSSNNWPFYSLTSSMRRSYQEPRHGTHLKGNTTRYGCSKRFVKQACGAVPTLQHSTLLPVSNQTSYTSEFGARGTPHLPPIHSSKSPQVVAASTQPAKAKGGEFTDYPTTWVSGWCGPM